MKYVVLMYSDPAQTGAMSTEDLQAIGRKHEALRTEWTSTGKLLNGVGMGYPADTTTLRVDGIFAGPLTAEPEQLTAWYVLECEGPEQAVAEAARVLDLHVTSVEVRHVHDSFGLG